ncbi:M28 family peptidase [Ascidiimonas sp. W6]|uniref:M28 family peptidase n=1 Tax=Ascidiimonas meishanensis TaxID=3128903 RepID=UPI0030ECFAE9
MKKYSIVISFLILVAAVYTTFYNRLPQKINPENAPKTEFSAARALKHVKKISEKPHYVGAPAHAEVRDYVIDELQKLGLQTGIHEGMNSGDYGNLSKATNIMARIEGTSKGKALLLLSHYDSSPHSSYGASDAGSGVATILEGLRAYLAAGKKPTNDIIILITDGEELGLNGADLFVNKHPWAEEIGLVLNFEARGSGGPAYMLIETNGGNSKLIEEFYKADPSYPVANSLAYSIYKMLPNDTDLTVFREDKNIDGFNFAFIDDHFDYHSALDRYDRLDKNTVAHLGSYLMPLLDYFSENDISSLKASNDYVYFTVPFFKMVYYPFSWILPSLIISILLFVIIFIIGIKRKTISITDSLKGFVPFLASLLICMVLGFFAYTILHSFYPQYDEILHKFPYNGYTYISAFILTFIGICFWVYSKFKKISAANLLIAPIVLWFVITSLASFYLKGASFFIIPAFASLAILYMISVYEKSSLVFITLLGIPAIWILTPFIQAFPVGLGFKMNVGSTEFSPFVLSALLSVCIFGLLIATFHQFPKLKKLGYFGILLGFIFFMSAHFDAGFTKNTPKPTSLVYLQDGNSNKSYWATYDVMPADWVKQYVNDKKNVETNMLNTVFTSKYRTKLSYASTATPKAIPLPEILISKDTVVGNERLLEICIKSKRTINRLTVFTEKGAVINSCTVNGSSLSKKFLESVKTRKRLITHYVSNNDPTEIEMSIPVNQPIKLHVFESSYDLLMNELFSVPPRPENCIPKPFILNDAIIVKKTISFE